MSASPATGHVEPGFEPVAEVLHELLEAEGELAISVAVHWRGRPVVDLCGGLADPETGRANGPDTLHATFSCSKGVIAALANRFLQDGRLHVDAPVADHWPEFAAAGKAGVTVGMLLAHQAGLPVLERELPRQDVLDGRSVAAALAEQAPAWEPGSCHGYHALTWGWLVGELLRRVDGRPIGRLVRDELAAPLGLDLWLGLPDDERPRLARLVPAPPPADPDELAALVAWLGAGTPAARALSLNGTIRLPDYADPAVLRAEIPSAGVVTTAASLSRLYAALLGPVEGGPPGALLDAGQRAAARVVRTSGDDQVMSTPAAPVRSTFGLGFQVSTLDYPQLGATGSFGHAGAGGSLGFADPAAELAFACTVNRLSSVVPGLAPDPRTRRLAAAAYRSTALQC